MSTSADDLWLRDGDERFAAFLRRLGFDHDEARDLAEKTRPPWGIWDRWVPRRLLPKNDIRRTEIVPMKDGSGFVEAPTRPEKKCICLNVTGHSIYCPANPKGRQPYPSADTANNIPPMPVAGHLRETAELLARPTGIPEAIARYRRNTTPGNYTPGPEYDGEPMIVSEERDMTDQIARGERGFCE